MTKHFFSASRVPLNRLNKEESFRMGHYLQTIAFLNTESMEEIISGHVSTQTVSI